MGTWVWVDGEVTREHDARLSALDRGTTSGEGVFETARVIDGTPFALSRHLVRLRRSAEIIGLTLPWGDSRVRSACARAVGAALVDPANAEVGVGRLRITVTAGPAPLGADTAPGEPTLMVAAGPQLPLPATTDVATVDWPRNERSPVVGAKTTSYVENLVALADARGRGAHEAILVNTVGALCEGTGSNVFLVVDEELCTPSLATGCLPGITRALVLELVSARERADLTADHLLGASEAFLTSSTRDVHPIAHVDGVALSAIPGPLTAAAADAFIALQARTLDP
jgi:branched-chain amino acid aminotransferase